MTLFLHSSLGSFETAALNLSYSSHSLAPLKSNELLLQSHSKSNLQTLEDKKNPKLVLKHKRVVSNPFDVLYGNNRTDNPLGDGQTEEKRYSTETDSKRFSGISFKTPTAPFSPKYPSTPQNLYNTYLSGNNYHHGKHSRVVSDLPPTVTLINQEELSRSNSIISRQASMKHRYNIIKRNKMVSKKSLDVNTPSFDTQSTFSEYKSKDHHYHTNNHNNNKKGSFFRKKLEFLFPVKRQTSLKKSSTYKLLRDIRNNRSKFKTKQDLDNFLIKCNAPQIMRELIPNNMKVFDYSNIFIRKPILKKSSRAFNINENNHFTIISPRVKHLNISAPFSTTLTKQGYNPFGQYPPQQPHKEFNLMESVYNQYRERAFASNSKIPPKFTDFFPDELDSSLVSPFDIDNFNKKLLLEILLRRTLAAKIDYRLKQHGYNGKRTRRDNEDTKSKDSSSSNSSDEDHRDIRDSHVPELIHTDSDNDDNDSLNTDDLMQQNQSLFSGLLPSPQISYKSDMFGDFDFKREFLLTKDSESGNELDDTSSKQLKSDYNRPRRTASTNDILKLVKQVTPNTPLESNFPGSNHTSPLGVRNPNSRNNSLPGSEVNKPYSNKKDEDHTKASSNLFDLKPINRSVDTFSSSSDSDRLSRTPPLELSRNQSLRSNTSTLLNNRRKSSESFDNPSSSSINLLALGNHTDNNNFTNYDDYYKKNDDSNKRDSNITGTSGDSTDNFDKGHRKSQSTTNTSIIKDLDDLSSQLSTYIKDPRPEQKFVHKNILTDDDPLFNQQISLSNQNILESIQLSTSSLERLNVTSILKPHIEHQAQDITSMKGSISMAGSDSSSQTAFKQPSITNRNLAAINESELSTMPTGGKSKPVHDNISTKINTTSKKRFIGSQYYSSLL